jgi:CheY-like chemotaxis protein
LEESGWLVVGFTDCNDAPGKVRREQPDVILMDNWIPDEGGIMATQALKNAAELRNIPVVYFQLTGTSAYWLKAPEQMSIWLSRLMWSNCCIYYKRL